MARNGPGSRWKQKRSVRLSESQGHRCAYCGEDIWGRITIDHIVPLSEGGSRKSWDNMVAACPDCNAGRGRLDPMTFYRLRSDMQSMWDDLYRRVEAAAY